MTIMRILITNGNYEDTYFEDEEDFYQFVDRCYAERWLFFKRVADLIETRENLIRYRDFCGTDEHVTESWIDDARYWEAVYRRKLENEWDDKDFEKFELVNTEKTKPVFEYGKISNGDSGIHWKSVGEIFNWICHICTEKTEPKAGTPKTRRGCTVDHVVPQSKGGANTWNNVRPAHWECNIKKNANI